MTMLRAATPLQPLHLNQLTLVNKPEHIITCRRPFKRAKTPSETLSPLPHLPTPHTLNIQCRVRQKAQLPRQLLLLL